MPKRFPVWFEHDHRRPGESLTRAAMRIYVEHGVHVATTRRALRGLPLRFDSAERLERATGGRVSRASLMEPTQTEITAA